MLHGDPTYTRAQWQSLQYTTTVQKMIKTGINFRKFLHESTYEKNGYFHNVLAHRVAHSRSWHLCDWRYSCTSLCLVLIQIYFWILLNYGCYPPCFSKLTLDTRELVHIHTHHDSSVEVLPTLFQCWGDNLCALFEDASCSKVLWPLKISGQGLRHGVIHNVTIVKAWSYKHLAHVVGCFDG